jgi:hypothetical protein
MNEKKPTPWIPQSKGKVCPVCGKQTYSHGGIHPQCATYQADAARTEKLKAERKRKASATKSSTWTRKKCPKCKTELHARRKVCDCGHMFL